MFKKMIVLMFLVLLLLPSVALADANLKQASPGDGETVTKEVKEIVLTFSTKIESLSQIELTNDAGNKVEGIKVSVDGTTLKATADQPLPNGSYTVAWKNVAVDGHTMKGTYTFKVDVPQTTTSPAAATTQPGQGSTANATDNSSSASPSPTGDVKTPPGTHIMDGQVMANDMDMSHEETANTNWTMIISLIVVIVVLAAGGVWWALRKKA